MQNGLYLKSACSFWSCTMTLVVLLCVNVAVQAQESWVMVGNSKVSEETASFLEKGEKLSAKQDFEGAVAEFRQAVKLSPQVPELHINLASVLNLTGKYAEAVSECKKALETNPNDSQAWSITGSAYQSLGRVEEALFAYKKYLQLSSPKDPARRQYVNAVQGLESNLKFRKTLPPSNPNNYLSEVTWDGVHCWASSKMPLKVFLADGRGVAGFRPEFNQIMRNSFAEWAKASNDKIAFVFVPNKKGCDISCAWSNDWTLARHQGNCEVAQQKFATRAKNGGRKSMTV